MSVDLDLSEMVTGVGVLHPGDRLVIVVDPSSTYEMVDRIGGYFRAHLPGTLFAIVAADGVVIDRSGAA